MTISVIFKSALPSFSYLYKDGVPAVFINGRYMTDRPEQIAELTAEVGAIGVTKSKHPYIYIDENEQEVDSEALSPIELLKLQAKEEARAELLAEQAAASARALNAGANVSDTDNGNFAKSLGNSNTIAQAGAAESTGPAVGVGIEAAAPGVTTVTPGSMAAKLAALKASQ